jgi:hypothetical protein
VIRRVAGAYYEGPKMPKLILHLFPVICVLDILFVHEMHPYQ